MTDVKRLLENATPLPWDVWHVGTSLSENEPDQDLVVHAVNSLPAYEAAVEALERMIALTDGWDQAIAGSLWQERVDDARDALRRLREEAS